MWWLEVAVLRPSSETLSNCMGGPGWTPDVTVYVLGWESPESRAFVNSPTISHAWHEIGAQAVKTTYMGSSTVSRGGWALLAARLGIALGGLWGSPRAAQPPSPGQPCCLPAPSTPTTCPGGTLPAFLSPVLCRSWTTGILFIRGRRAHNLGELQAWPSEDILIFSRRCPVQREASLRRHGRWRGIRPKALPAARDATEVPCDRASWGRQGSQLLLREEADANPWCGLWGPTSQVESDPGRWRLCHLCSTDHSWGSWRS